MLTEEQKRQCAAWCKSHYWQIQNRGKWRYRYHEEAMVRYYEAANLDAEIYEPLLEYLNSDACLEWLSVHNKKLSRQGWKTKNAWYETQEGNIDERTKLKRVRIYHALVKNNAEGEGDGPYKVEDGCCWKVTHEFYWKQNELPSLPESSSGVNYRMQGVIRDDETGLYSCVIERRERVEQSVDEYLSEADAFKNVKREEVKGVKGDTSEGGKAASVTKGKLVTRTVSKNEDCTHDVGNVTVESKSVEGAVTETAVGLRGESTLKVNRNMPDKAREGGLEPGESVRNEQNEDLTWNQTIRSWNKNFTNWLRGVCRKTIFRHTHAVTTARGSDPGFTHSDEAFGGVIHEVDVQRTEQGWEVTDTKNVDSPVQNAVVETRKTINGIVRRVTHRNQPGPAPTSGMKIGETVRNEMTDSGLVDQTIETSDIEDVGRVAEECEKNALVHTHGRTDVVASNPGAVDALTVSGGVIHEKSVQKTETGAHRVTSRTRSAQKAEASGGGGSEGVSVETTCLRNADSIPHERGGVNVEVEVSASPNEFGKVDGTRRVTTHHPVESVARSGTMLVDEERRNGINQTEAPNEEPSRGTVYDASSSPNEHGSMSTTVVKRTAKPAIETSEWTDVEISLKRKRTYSNRIVVFRNQEEVPSLDPGNGTCSPSISINEFGLLDGVLHFKSLLSDEEYGGGSGSGPTEQWDQSSYIDVVKTQTLWDKKKKRYYTVEKTAHVRKRILHSTRYNVVQEITTNPGYPHLGLISKVVWGSGSVAEGEIYMGLEDETDWKVKDMLPGAEGDGGNGGGGNG